MELCHELPDLPVYLQQFDTSSLDAFSRDRAHALLRDTVLWDGLSDPGHFLVKTAVEITQVLPCGLFGTRRYSCRIIRFDQSRMCRRTFHLQVPRELHPGTLMSGAQLTIMRTKVNFGTFALTLETASRSSLAFLTDRENPVTTLDLFSGFGGWTWGASMAMGAGSIKLPPFSASIEWDEPTARIMADNFSLAVVSTDDFLDQSKSIPEQHFVLVADVNDDHTYQRLSTLNVDLIIGSPSCQSWSGGGSQMGLAHVNGRHFLSFIKMCSSLLPRCFGFENVRGLMRHSHWSILERIITQVGYREAFLRCEEPPIVPLQRERTLAIFVRADFDISPSVILCRMYLSVPVPRTLSSWQCLHPQDSTSGCNWIFLDNNQLDIVFSAEFLPIWMRGKSMQHVQIADFRILTADSKMGPIMASYGISLDFSMSTLASKGWYGQIIESEGRFRLLHPGEIASAMGFGCGIILPLDPAFAYKVLGNCIIPVHACLHLSRIAVAMFDANNPMMMPANPAAMLRVYQEHPSVPAV